MLNVIDHFRSRRSGRSGRSRKALGAIPYGIRKSHTVIIGRSMTKGALTPSQRNPATKVVIFQWPCGIRPTTRQPRLARPRVRAMLVLVPVSSMNTKCAGSRVG